MFLPQHQRLLVAGAFAGELGVINLESGNVESVRRLAGHNLHGLALSASGDEAYISHPQLRPDRRADYEDLTWGRLLSNGVLVLPVKALLDPAADLVQAGRLIDLRNAGDAAGDPASLQVLGDGSIVVLLAGDNQVAIGSIADGFERIDVGRNPVAAGGDGSGRWLYVANRTGESASVVDFDHGVVRRTIRLAKEGASTAVDRGERLFYDARLSHDRWLSCHSCHTDGHANGQLVDTLGDGGYGDPKRVPSLLGVRGTQPFAWNGSIPKLEAQVRKSILTTLHGPPLSDEQAADLTAYLRSLQPPPSAAEGNRDADLVAAGKAVFARQGCGRCHGPPSYTSEETYDVGLEDRAGNTRFSPPSLRGVFHRSSYCHEGRAATLDEVFRVHQHQLSSPLSDQSLAELVGFLRSL